MTVELCGVFLVKLDMPKKVQPAARENYWQKRKLYRVLKAENVSSQINFAIVISSRTLN